MPSNEIMMLRTRWRLVCHECGHVHVQRQAVDAAAVEYAPPPVPTCCESCDHGLTDEPGAWHRTFCVEGFDAL